MRTRLKKKTPGAERRGTDLDSIPPPPPTPSAFKDLPTGWKPAAVALDRVRAVRTIFPDFNRAIRVGGLPVRRIHTVHGPTHGGKTAFIGGLLRSFVDAGHVAAYVDAEHATPRDFFDELFGRPTEEVPNLLAERSEGYEETIDKIDSFLKWMRGKRQDDPNLASIVVVDSINKLVPKRELEKLRKEGGEALDKGWGRLRAAFNQAWLDHLTPRLAAAECAMVIIAQERDEQEQGWGYQEEFKVKGGAALLFDASCVIRISKSTPIRDGADKDSPIVGFKHRARIWKSKVGHMDGRFTDCVFHLSNGVLAPAGFDLARDALYVGANLEVVKASGSWLSWGKKRWQGENRAIAALNKDRAALDSLIADVAREVDKQAGRDL